TSCGMASPVKARGDQRSRNSVSIGWADSRPVLSVISNLKIHDALREAVAFLPKGGKGIGGQGQNNAIPHCRTDGRRNITLPEYVSRVEDDHDPERSEPVAAG